MYITIANQTGREKKKSQNFAGPLKTIEIKN